MVIDFNDSSGINPQDNAFYHIVQDAYGKSPWSNG